MIEDVQEYRRNLDGTPSGFIKTVRKYVADDITYNSADKKEIIVKDILDVEDQLNLLALIVEQIGDSIALDTSEYTYAKAKFAEIKAVLNGTT